MSYEPFPTQSLEDARQRGQAGEKNIYTKGSPEFAAFIHGYAELCAARKEMAA